MFADTFLNRLLLTCIASSLSLVAPLAVMSTAVRITGYSDDLPAFLVHLFDLWWVRVWMGIELLFLAWSLAALRSSQKPSVYTQLTAMERTDLFNRAIHQIHNPQAFFEGWFADQGENLLGRPVQLGDIHYDNVAEWISWAFFGLPRVQVDAQAKWAGQIHSMLEALEARLGAPFPPGYNPNVRCIRLNYDPVHAIHRPFLIYLCVLTMDFLLKLVLRFKGFRRYGRLPRSLPLAIFPSLSSLLSSSSVPEPEKSNQVTYWYRPGSSPPSSSFSSSPSSPPPKPIIFVHGIGIGILPYISFILRLIRTITPSSSSSSSSSPAPIPPIYLVELSEVAMRLNLNPSPTIPIVVTEMAMALTERGHHQAVWVGHSLGSSVVAGACRWARESVAATVFIDPICFLLHYPNVAWNFVHRRGIGADERFTEYFASRELSISRYISRDFQWWHSCVFADQIPQGQNSSVYLSAQDALVPSARVKAYLEEHRIQTTMMPHGHAGFLFNSEWEIPISRRVLHLAQSS